MRVLVIVGECLLENSSANLCHVKYIEGLIKKGYLVDLLTVSKEGLNIDNSMEMPTVNRIIEYKDSLYKRRGQQSKERSAPKNVEGTTSQKTTATRVKRIIKNFVRGLYGIYGIETGWMLRAMRFSEKRPYDLLISLSFPAVSHRLAEILILMKRIKVKKWIQIWEDPWYCDLSVGVQTDKIKREEGRLISAADYIYYVSPLTLTYQKQLYPQCAKKMRWQPLPSYYEDGGEVSNFSELTFGYFGDYASKFRNLIPFYRYAVESRIRFTVCGNSDMPLASDGNTVVYPRLSLEQLRPIEAETNVLVYVCNLHGGQIPGKIYQYSATNKYILFILDGTEEEKRVLYDYFCQFNRYVFCENREESIAEAVQKIRDGKLPEKYHRALDCFKAETIIENILKGI